MAATGKLKARLTIPRRGGTKGWSTSFHLNEEVPDLTTFEDLCDALTGSGSWYLQSMFFSEVELVGFDYYPPGDDVARWSKPVSFPGGLTVTDSDKQSSDSVTLARWSTTARTIKNHPIYLFNYLHGVHAKRGAAVDVVDNDQLDAQHGFLERLVAGVTANGTTFKRAGPDGAVAQSVLVEEYVHHRDFPK